MLTFILPPIIILAAVGVLSWMFWKKKRWVDRVERGVIRHIPGSDQTFQSEDDVIIDAVSSSDVQSDADPTAHDREIPLNAVESSVRDESGDDNRKGILKKVVNIPRLQRSFTFGISGAVKKFFTKYRQKNSHQIPLDNDDMELFDEPLLHKDEMHNIQKNSSVRSVVEIEPRNSKVRTRVSVADKKVDFEELLIERIAADPQDIDAYEELGGFYMKRKNFDDAKECYKQVLRITPTHRGVRAQMKKLEKILAKGVMHK